MSHVCLVITGAWVGSAVTLIALGWKRSLEGDYLVTRHKIVPTPEAGEGYDFGCDKVDRGFAERMAAREPGVFRIVRGK